MPYDRYPAVDEDYLFPPEVREANGLAPEFRNQVAPLTQTQRNNLTGDELWNGRLILNTTTNRIDRYDTSAGEWIPMTSEPAGVIKLYGGATAPEFHVLADGAVYARTGIYAALFAKYGTTYNVGGELSTEFRVPNLKGKVPVGVDAGQAEFNGLGEQGGEKTHTLSVGEMPSHNHGGATGGHTADHAHSGSTAGEGGHLHNGSSNIGDGGEGGTAFLRPYPDVNTGSAGPVTINRNDGSGNHGHAFSTGGASSDHAHGVGAQGGGAAANNLQPYIALHYIITL